MLGANDTYVDLEPVCRYYPTDARYIGGMKQTKKIRLVLEAEIQQDTELTLEVVARVLGKYSNYSPEMVEENGWQENVHHNQVLLTALLKNPALYNHFLLDTLLGTIEGSLYRGDLVRLAGQNPKEEPLRQLLSSLPSETNLYFQEVINEDLFSENTDFTDFSLQTNFTKVYIEDAEPPMSKPE